MAYLSFIWLLILYFLLWLSIIRIFSVGVLTVFCSWVFDFLNEILVFKVYFIIIAGMWEHIQFSLIYQSCKLINYNKYGGWKICKKKKKFTIHSLIHAFQCSQDLLHVLNVNSQSTQPGLIPNPWCKDFNISHLNVMIYWLF